MRSSFIICLVILVVPLVVFSQKKVYKILFVGNSLTYSNDLPSMVSELAGLDSIRVQHKSVAFPDYSLEDHWNDGEVEDEIEKGNYDYVILQQGPSALDESRILLIEYTKRFAQVCNKANTKAVLFIVWPSKARLFDLDRVISNYTEAAKQSNSLLAPAGLAWKLAWEKNQGLPFYSADNFHPSDLGSRISAMAIYFTLREVIDPGIVAKKILWLQEMHDFDREIIKLALQNALIKN